MRLSHRAIMAVLQSTSTSRMARTWQSGERVAQRTYATGPFQAMSIARAKSASVCSSYEENSTGTIGTPASSKYARIPSQMVATLGPAATAPTRTTVFVITLPSVVVSRFLALRYGRDRRSEEHTSELQSLAYLVCRLLLEKKKKNNST